MVGDRIILTRAGYDQLTKELAQLEEMRQGEIEQVADAFDDSDFGDNAVFYDAVFDKDRLTARINNLRHVLARAEVIDELWSALRLGHAPLHDGRWSTATTEACLALLDSAREERDMMLKHQVAPCSLT